MVCQHLPTLRELRLEDLSVGVQIDKMAIHFFSPDFVVFDEMQESIVSPNMQSSLKLPVRCSGLGLPHHAPDRELEATVNRKVNSLPRPQTKLIITIKLMQSVVHTVVIVASSVGYILEMTKDRLDRNVIEGFLDGYKVYDSF